ncbi:MAG: ATPase [Treponema sp.]|uniref:V-type ATP synthase subunit I n=1 Tax=Treponema sp. TaxID=166 RepID=UPI00298DB4CD|nr:V-type ATPase 116kDa subunit family protein [Treponema sp.]MCQ2601458.1 ATPase [Treponema sp.]
MAKTTPMRLVELMVLKQDISKVLSYLGKQGCFQFQSAFDETEKSKESINQELEYYRSLDQVRAYLNLKEFSDSIIKCELPEPQDFDAVTSIVNDIKELQKQDADEHDNNKRITEAYDEALAFSNLKASYSDLEHLSFLSLRIGKIDPKEFDELKFDIGNRAIVLPLGDDKSRILAASSKKGRFALDTELKKHNFVNMEIPEDFKGIPDDVLDSLRVQKSESDKKLELLSKQRNNFADTHKASINTLLGKMSLACQVRATENKLESTKLVYRITGWLPLLDTDDVIKHLEAITEKRIAIRKYEPEEVPSVVNGREQVPVELKHGKFVSSFKRMIFSYGSPVYGTIDPTPFVAIFFTILFGIMFGDAGQGLVFLLAGILMACKVIKVGGWNKFAPIFMAIGITSMIMGVLTGEFFANEEILEPVSLWITGLFGKARHPILHMMPSSDPHSIVNMFKFFGFSVAVGFIINSTGLILNIINNLSRKKFGKAFFGKYGLFGACFFWYVIIFVVRVFLFKMTPQIYDWIVIGVTLFFAAFGEPFERLIDGERPVIENGLGAALIGGLVELIEVLSGYMSNTVSFLRVGAFALAHAVLGFIIAKMSGLAPAVGGVAISIIGNVIVIVLEGMIVAIQVIRLQYYEFFSKFFNETGREFKPFQFTSTPEFK